MPPTQVMTDMSLMSLQSASEAEIQRSPAGASCPAPFVFDCVCVNNGRGGPWLAACGDGS